MKAVNLLPERHRPKRASGGKSGSSYFLLGGLAVLVVAILVYVATLNSINSSKTDIAKAKAETVQANARAEALGPYGEFAKVASQRVDAVKQLAGKRVDWERVARELARVLPGGVWIQHASANDGSGAAAADGSSTSSASTSANGTPGGAAMTIEGCARDQRSVATTLVRLREIEGASDVKLEQSSQPSAESGTTSSSSSGGSTGDCGTTHGHTNYSFQVVVSLETDAMNNAKASVPRSLGGGQ